MEGFSVQEPVQHLELDEDFLRCKAEAQALDLSWEAAAAYVAEQRKQLHQQILFENDLQHQQGHRDEQHQLYIDQQEAIHVVNRERSAELHD